MLKSLQDVSFETRLEAAGICRRVLCYSLGRGWRPLPFPAALNPSCVPRGHHAMESSIPVPVMCTAGVLGGIGGTSVGNHWAPLPGSEVPSRPLVSMPFPPLLKSSHLPTRSTIPTQQPINIYRNDSPPSESQEVQMKKVIRQGGNGAP